MQTGFYDLNTIKKELGTGMYNPSSSANFILEIPDFEMTQVMRANIQATNLPTFIVPPTQMGIKEMGQTWGAIPSATMEYEPMVLRVMMDEDWNAFKELYSWQCSISNPTEGHNTAFDANSRRPLASLHILNNTRDKIVLTLVFDGPWPQDVGNLEMDYTEQGHLTLILNCVLNFKRVRVFDGPTGLEIGPRILTE